MPKEYKGAPGRGDRYFFDHKIRRGMSGMQKTGRTYLYSLEFQDSSLPTGVYALLGWTRPNRKGDMLVSMRNEQGTTLDVPWTFGNVLVHGISTAKCDHEKKELVLYRAPAESDLPRPSLVKTMETQLGKIQSLAALLGLDQMVQEISGYTVREA
jgi:hypothetical protein